MQKAFIKKETLAKVFSCEFCEIYKNNFFTEHLYATARDEIYMSHLKFISNFSILLVLIRAILLILLPFQQKLWFFAMPYL